MIGKTFGNYQITEKIGAGGMGEVYRARDTKLGRDVAIKVLPVAFASQPERLSRFEREAKLLAGLNHAHIAGIYGIEEVEGKQVLVLELVEGEELAQRLARGPLPLEEVLEAGQQIAEALEAAHENGIIHRDLKPSNIKLTPAGQVKILDFGLAKALEPGGETPQGMTQSPTLLGSSPTMSGVILGTAAYMSPEQARGKSVDKRADIFAFGVVLMEMLTGKPVFRGETVTDILAGVLRAEPQFEALPAGTPAALRRLLDRCLEKDVRRRLRDIGEARIALEHLRAGVGFEADDVATSDVAKPKDSSLQRHAGWIAAAVFAVASGVLLWSRNPGQAPTPLPLVKSLLHMSADDPGRLDNFSPALSPDGRYLVYASRNQLWLRDRGIIDPLPIAGTEGAVRPFWSPDGEWIAFGRNQQLFKVPRVGGRPTLISQLPMGVTLGNASNACWTPDGHVVIGPGTAGLYRASAQGGQAALFLPTGEGETDFHEVCLLPDNRGFLFIVHNEKGIGRLDAVSADGTRSMLLQVEENLQDPAYSPSGHVLFHRTGASAGIWALPFSLERLETTGEPFLVAADAVHPSVARDGTLSFVTGVQTSRAELVWVGRDGQVLASIGRPEAITRPFPNLSPDGKSVLVCGVFGDGREVFLYDVASGNRRRLTFNEHREEIARWHPAGREVLYYETGSFNTHVLSLDGSSESRIVAPGIMVDFTPDASQVVFAKQKENAWDWDLLVQPYEAGEHTPQVLVQSDAVEWWPAISPDGKILLYVSDETGRDEVYATNFPDLTTRWQISVEGGQWPRWRADGREIYFTTQEHLYTVDVSASPGFTLGAPSPLFRRPTTHWSTQWSDGFDVTPDGQRFLFLRPVLEENARDPMIVVVQNWFAEFDGSMSARP